MIRIRQLKLSINHNEDNLINKISKILKCKKEEIKSYTIIKKSLDARNKGNILYSYILDVNLIDETNIISKVKSNDIFKVNKEEYNYIPKGTFCLKTDIVVVGAGPSGLFLAYMLSMNGYKPLVIERGEKVEDRIKSIEEFWKSNNLNTNSNVQFGEGGAGTFSDGKLNTLVKDKRFIQKKVFEIFIECGAPKEIMTDNKPHIGTDLLRNVVINMRNKIIKMGGKFRYNTSLTNLVVENETLKEIVLNYNETIKCEHLFLCIGHSARDTYYMLNEKGINMKNKPFAVGVRIEHNAKDIDKAMYKENYLNILGPASYKLTYNNDNRAVYSFCMCPGGYVVNASSEKGRLVVNGMSNYKRDSGVSNSAIVVSVTEKDYGYELFDGLKFQRKLEENAYNALNGLIPVQKYVDFKNRKVSTNYGKVFPLTKGSYGFYDINKILPTYISKSLVEGIESFGNKIKGFNSDDAIILGVETRTSSPITILRDENGMSNIKGIYPCGEGAGYAGGITTSSMDGIKQAEKFMNVYKQNI